MTGKHFTKDPTLDLRYSYTVNVVSSVSLVGVWHTSLP